LKIILPIENGEEPKYLWIFQKPARIPTANPLIKNPKFIEKESFFLIKPPFNLQK